MVISREDIVRNIKSKGFEKDSSNLNRDHDYYYLQYNGKETHIFVKISRGKEYKDYREPVLKKQALIWKVTFRDVVKFFICEYQYKDLIDIFIRNGQLKL